MRSVPDGPGLSRSFILRGLLSFLVLSACATPRSDETVPPPPRPEHCELQEVGPIRVPARYRSKVRESLYDMIRQMGYDRITDVREITEVWRSQPGGVLQTRLVGWEGIVWRWNDPACRMGR